MHLTIQNTDNTCLKHRQNHSNIAGQIKRSVQLIPNGESLVYFSDFHSNISHLPAITGLTKKIEQLLSSEKVLKFCTGDFIFGENPPNTSIIINTLNRLGLTAIIPGNHEFDCSLKKLKDIFTRLKMPVIMTNQTEKGHSLNARDSLVCSNHHSDYGVISITTDSGSLKNNPFVKDFEQSIPVLQQKIDHFEQKGIHKIILLSHQGLEKDKLMAQRLNGVDIIISAHDHYVIDGIEEGINLTKSSKNEPVAIFQAAKNNEVVGYARVKFDEKGILQKIYNKTLPITTKGYNKDKITVQEIQQKGHSKFIGNLLSDLPIDEINTAECAAGNFFADSIHTALPPVDVVLLPSRMIRSSLYKGPIETTDIEETLPERRIRHEDAFKVVKISGQKIIDIINRMNNLQKTPYGMSITHVSGMKYKLDTNYQVCSASIDFNGKFKSLLPDKDYTVALPGFLFVNRKLNNLGLNELPIIEETGKTASDLVKESFLINKGKVSAKTDERITLQQKVNTSSQNLKLSPFMDLY